MVVAAVAATSSSLTPIDLHPWPFIKGNQCPGRGTSGPCVPYLKTQLTVAGLGDDPLLLPLRMNTPGLSLVQILLGYMSWLTYLACFLRTQTQQVFLNTCRCKLFCQKVMEKMGLLVLCVFGFWMFSMHLPSKVEVWQDDSINGPLQSLRMYQEKVRHHTGEIQDLRGSMNQLIAKLQKMEAISDEQKMAQKIMKMIQGDYIEKPDFALKSIEAETSPSIQGPASTSSTRQPRITTTRLAPTGTGSDCGTTRSPRM
ncbi:SUN domain-containing protein 5 isoform X5 [Mus musculus]|uniref:SUN domain-containing protein 5 isoform X5 n=1 Tax=Mus musculus TaxID=10090 RepID=UPI0005ABAE17|nr:SUN domain-containing protein 5 isoform X5 [Mus musculus]|eukprot:XP_011238140.1 PREDICTED: SUN domain-containing protein 5 isoform X4 [Mus musculus]